MPQQQGYPPRSVDVNIYSSTGRSGISLDRAGHVEAAGFYFVADGVSPIATGEKFHTESKKFAVFMDRLVKNLKDSALIEAFKENPEIYLASQSGFSVLPWSKPMSSLLLLWLREHQNQLNVSWSNFGDTSILIREHNLPAKHYKNEELLRLKRKLNIFFHFVSISGSSKNSTASRLIVFSLIRALQDARISWPLISTRHTKIRKHNEITLSRRPVMIAMLSDGASEVLDSGIMTPDDAIDLLLRDPARLIDASREASRSSGSFGAEDDATILLLRV